MHLLYSMLLDHYTYLRILSNSVFTHITQFSSELYNQQNILTYMFFGMCIVI